MTTLRSEPVEPIVTKTASDKMTARRPALFYGSAREGMRDFLAQVLSSPHDGVLLPAFIGLSPREGSGVLDPVQSVGARAGFYDLNADLTVDVDALQRSLDAQPYRVLVVIHYFGRTEPRLEEIRALADDFGVLVVEDLAHGFFTAQSTGNAGRLGHVNLFSLHKMFPFPDGGMVQYSSSDLIKAQTQTRPELAQRILDYDWAAIANARRENFLVLSKRLAALPERGRDFELLWEALAGEDVPQTLPVRIAGNQRDAVYAGMNSDGYGMVSLYHTLITPVRHGFEVLNDLARHIINFPVHQDVELADIDGMIESFRRHIAANRGDLDRTVGNSP